MSKGISNTSRTLEYIRNQGPKKKRKRSPLTEEHKRNISKGIKNSPFSNKGKKFSKEWRKNLSDAHKGKGCGKNNPNWKGGKVGNGDGYIRIKVLSNSPYFPMASKAGYVLEHRLVVAKVLGRCLFPWEV